MYLNFATPCCVDGGGDGECGFLKAAPEGETRECVNNTDLDENKNCTYKWQDNEVVCDD